MNSHAAASGKKLQEDVREKGALENLKFELGNIETLPAILVGALGEDPMLRRRMKRLANRSIEPFLNSLEK